LATHGVKGVQMSKIKKKSSKVLKGVQIEKKWPKGVLKTVLEFLKNELKYAH
jgi:hypothetical protein